MKKTISGVLLALTAVFTLVACGKKKTTSGEETTKKGGTTKAATTAKKTTKLTSKQAIQKTNKLVFYCWNTEFKSRVDEYYANTNYYDATTTYLTDGTYIEWINAANEGGGFQETLDQGLSQDKVDMFVFEADYATKYVKSDKVANLSTIEGFDNSKQYKYTKDIIMDGTAVKGTSWQATPGVTIYNQNVADAVWGTWEKKDGKDVLKTPVSYETVADKLSTEAKFEAAAAEVKAAKKNKFMMIGPDCWYRMYSNNLSDKMLKDGVVTVDDNLFVWAKTTMEYFQKRYIRNVDDDYALWGAEWGAEQGKDNCLCIFSVPWFTDFCLNGYRFAEGEEDVKLADRSDSKLRVAKSHKGWFWGGTWLTATVSGLAKDTIKTSIANLIKGMTTDTDTLVAIAKGAGDFTNSEAAMDELAADDTLKVGYFGGQNTFKIYADSIKGADLSNASDYDQHIAEQMQNAFRQYFQGFLTAAQAWDEFQTKLIEKVSTLTKDKIKYSTNITLGDDITIATPTPSVA